MNFFLNHDDFIYYYYLATVQILKSINFQTIVGNTWIQQFFSQKTCEWFNLLDECKCIPQSSPGDSSSLLVVGSYYSWNWNEKKYLM